MQQTSFQQQQIAVLKWDIVAPGVLAVHMSVMEPNSL